jgi:hypothetical protein
MVAYETEGGCNTRLQDNKEGVTVLAVRAIPPSPYILREKLGGFSTLFGPGTIYRHTKGRRGRDPRPTPAPEQREPWWRRTLR